METFTIHRVFMGHEFANTLKPHEIEPHGKTWKFNSWGFQEY